MGKHTEEGKLNNSIAQTGKVLSEETKEKIRQANIGKQHALGYEQTEEHIRKCAEAKTGAKNYRSVKIEISDGKIYSCLTEAAEDMKCSKTTMSRVTKPESKDVGQVLKGFTFKRMD